MTGPASSVGPPELTRPSFLCGGTAVIVGSSGGIGHALAQILGGGQCAIVIGLHRQSLPAVDITQEESIAAAAEYISAFPPIRLIVNATGLLQGGSVEPEKTWRQLNTANLAHYFAVNAIGPALLMKHFLPLLARNGKSVFATLSARVGSISDNRLGGWYGYRASKAALNQFVRTASVELRRQRPDGVCVALHPGTVNTPLSSPHAKRGLIVREPEDAAKSLLNVCETLTAGQTGTFLDYSGREIPW